MNIYEVIKDLSNKKKISIYKIEHDLNMANGSIGKWNKSEPTATNLQRVASYLGVTTDYILNTSKTTK